MSIPRLALRDKLTYYLESSSEVLEVNIFWEYLLVDSVDFVIVTYGGQYLIRSCEIMFV
jgi:hypothetical protein